MKKLPIEEVFYWIDFNFCLFKRYFDYKIDNMEYGDQIFNFLSDYGYWMMLPLMIIEGPVATLASAIFASLGAFNVFVVLFFSIIGDIVGDVIFYSLGSRYEVSFVEKTRKIFGISEKRIEKINKYFENHGGKTIFAAKSTTGLGWITFIIAGSTKMNFNRFIFYSFLGGLIWSGFLVSMGYFYGYLWREASQYIEWAGWIVFGLAVFSFVLVYLYKRKKTRKIFNGVLAKK